MDDVKDENKNVTKKKFMIENAIDISKIDIVNYVVVNNELIEIPLDVISLSKNLSKLKEILENK